MLDATGLMVFYENMLALNNVSIACAQNQIVGVFGANSAGKSTLMYTLSGIMEDIRKKEEMAGGERITVVGRILYLGQEIMGLKPSQRARMGVILCPERRRIFVESNVLENLRIGGYLASPSQAKESLGYVFKIFPALEKIKKRVGGFLSGGEQQMLAIGRALMYRPRLLCIDEPSTGLAPILRRQVFEKIGEIRNLGITLLLVEQEVSTVFKMASRNYVLSAGKIIAEGTGEQLLKDEVIRKTYLGL